MKGSTDRSACPTDRWLALGATTAALGFLLWARIIITAQLPREAIAEDPVPAAAAPPGGEEPAPGAVPGDGTDRERGPDEEPGGEERGDGALHGAAGGRRP